MSAAASPRPRASRARRAARLALFTLALALAAPAAPGPARAADGAPGLLSAARAERAAAGPGAGAGTGAGAGDARAAPHLRIGVRGDAPPFSYRRRALSASEKAAGGPADPDDFGGYVVDVCKQALARMPAGAPAEWIEVSAAARMDLLRDQRIDVLCDPSTLTARRLSHPELMASQPIYLSGVGFASHPPREDGWNRFWPCRGAVIGVVDGTTADRPGVRVIHEAQGFEVTPQGILGDYRLQRAPGWEELSPRHQARLVECAVAAREAGEPVCPEGVEPVDAVLGGPTCPLAPKPLVQAFESHDALAAAFCADEVYHYVGDVEIVSRILFDRGGCPFQIQPHTFTEERYAIYVNAFGPDAAQSRLAVAFLRSLAIAIHRGRRSALVDAFEANFQGAEISPTLDVFMWSVVAKEGN
ncbi:hypothetical protein ACQ5SO_16605 [Rhodovulum sp. DZ06]|uniref:hypothetical protein n=1 Tax=Rhodovulum sp. DZ06 TaxID=3425126 RepID=UPI003D3504FC